MYSESLGEVIGTYHLNLTTTYPRFCVNLNVKDDSSTSITLVTQDGLLPTQTDEWITMLYLSYVDIILARMQDRRL